MCYISLIGVPLDLGAENLGVDIGPNAFRYQNIISKLESTGLNIKDLGNINSKDRHSLAVGNPKLKYLEEIIRVSEELAKTVDLEIKKGNKILVLGGDHSVCLGAVSGVSENLNQNLGLIYLDAHGDLNTDKTTETGNIHGMHLSSLLGFGDVRLINVYSKKTKILKNNLLHIGGYDLDDGEVKLIEKEKLDLYKIVELLSFGLDPLLKKIKNLSQKLPNIWVSLDLDVIDEIYAPGAGMPNKAGLSYREISTICKYIGENCNVIGVDITEYNPLQDVNGKTAELGIELIAKLFNKNYSWYSNYLSKNKS